MSKKVKNVFLYRSLPYKFDRIIPITSWCMLTIGKERMATFPRTAVSESNVLLHWFLWRITNFNATVLVIFFFIFIRRGSIWFQFFNLDSLKCWILCLMFIIIFFKVHFVSLKNTEPTQFYVFIQTKVAYMFNFC